MASAVWRTDDESGRNRRHRLEWVGVVALRRGSGVDGASWNPATGAISPDGLDGVDAVVHLAGENIAASRWTDAQKARIRDSRVDGTRRLAETLAQRESRPSALIVAS